MTKLIWTKAELSANGGHTPECETVCHDSCPIGQERRREANARAANAQKLWHDNGIRSSLQEKRDMIQRAYEAAIDYDGDRYMEAILGARLMLHFPIGSVKTQEDAKRCDQLTVRWSKLAGRSPFDEVEPFPAGVPIPFSFEDR
jgi:hypothetical protein